MTQRLSKEELREIAARAEVASAEPWYWGAREFEESGLTLQERWIIGPLLRYNHPSDELEGAQSDADYTFIAHSRTDIPRLLQLIDQQQAEIERKTELLEKERHVGYSLLKKSQEQQSEIERLRIGLERIKNRDGLFEWCDDNSEDEDGSTWAVEIAEELLKGDTTE